jgi:hypothetical protein
MQDEGQCDMEWVLQREICAKGMEVVNKFQLLLLGV